MTIYIKITINGNAIDFNDCYVTKSLSDIDTISTFEININNYKGNKSTSYVIGNEVLIYSDLNINPPTTKIFAGILEDIKLTGEGLDERLTLTGRDYSARLVDRTVEPEVYNNQLAGDIVKDIITKYTNDITTTNVSDGIIIQRMVFNQTPVFDAINQLASLCEFMFYVDENKDLHFREKSTASSGKTFNSTNIISTTFKEKRDTVFNQVWVYGDRYLDGYKETFTGVVGSTYTLLYQPYNTFVSMSGTIPIAIQPGGIYQMTYDTGSMVRYLVNFDDRQIILTSGTAQGNNLYVGSKIDVVYQRSLPIIKVGDNEASKIQYGTRVKVIQDKNIKDPSSAEAIMLTELAEYSDPLREGTLKIRNVSSLTPGETCVVDIPIYGISNQTYDILEVNYDFTMENNRSNTVLSITVNKRLTDLTDTIKDILLQLKKLQSADISSTDLLTRYQWSTGSVGIRQSGIEIYTRYLGSDYIWGMTNVSHPFVWGVVGSGIWLGSYAYPNYNLVISGGYF